jgi:putative peptidoglycan lipid II flippase
MKLRVALALAAGTAMGLAFLMQWMVVALVGPGLSTDALFAALAIPQLLLAVVNQSLIHVLVPLLASSDRESVRRDTWSFLLLVSLVFGGIALPLWLLAPFWSPLLFPGLAGPEVVGLLVQLARIQLLAMVMSAASGVLMAAHHARSRFLQVEFVNIGVSAVLLLLLYLAIPHFGITAAAWLMVFRPFLQVVLLLPEFGAPVAVDLRSANVRTAWERIRPLLAGNSYYKLDPLLDRTFSSLAPAGGLSLLYLGQQFYAAANTVLNKAVAVPLVPQLSRFAASHDWISFRRAYRRSFGAVGFFTVTSFVSLLVVGRPLLELLIGRGGLTHENVDMLYLLMIALSGVYIGGALGQVSSAAFYAQGDTRTPTRIGIITFTGYVPLKIAAFFLAGLPGLAASTSGFVVINVLLQHFVLERRLAEAE